MCECNDGRTVSGRKSVIMINHMKLQAGCLSVNSCSGVCVSAVQVDLSSTSFGSTPNWTGVIFSFTASLLDQTVN